MAGVFINYRSQDQPLGAAAIHDHLARRFGAGRVFRDCVSMNAGEHYPAELRAALLRADILLSVIGPDWLVMSEGKQRLIDRPSDWVRFEIATALQRRVHVLPVLLKDTPASAPQISRGDLPADISDIALLQVFEFSQLRFGADLDRLTARVVQLVPSLADEFESPTPAAVPACATTTEARDVYIAGNGVIGINNGGMR